MNYSKNIIREWKLSRFTVRMEAIEESDIDLSFDETGEVLADLEAGLLVSFCAKASVLLDGNEIASDYLGSCIYKTYADFMDHAECAAQNREYARKGDPARVGSYFSGMIKGVVADAREYVSSLSSVKVRA